MIIIPAIDLKEGQCVRLSQGKMERATVYSRDPVQTAKRWESLGARRIHVVDLDGAVEGSPKNKDTVLSIVSSVSVPVQLGGGIRDEETIRKYLDSGIDRVILGTGAIQNSAWLEEISKAFPGKILVGIDAKDNMVSISGWTEQTHIRAIDFAKSLNGLPLAGIVFTDISRDGMLTGPNIESTRQLAESITIPVIASGGIATLEDIRLICEIESSGIEGIIIGKALYTGALDLTQCLAIAEKGW